MGGPGAGEGAARRLLQEAGALLEGHFQLSSGRHSPLYVEKFRLLERPPQTAALCRMIADWAGDLSPQLVAGPTTGGIIISYEVARLLGVRGIFAEILPGKDGRAFGRGFTIARGERTLVVDDVLTTGGSVRDVIEAVRAAGGEPVGVAVLVDRSAGKVDFGLPAGKAGLPFFACLALDLPAYEPGACPLCERGVALTVT
ncbi:MAG: orotate phosphoribosyltransferase [Dehalococcoidia bacterium]|nr:orotate phosphoribosyltransferase [Dehalococcoidia bacterium]